MADRAHECAMGLKDLDKGVKIKAFLLNKKVIRIK